MRKVLTWIGAAALVFVVAGAAGFGYLMLKGNALDEEARAYADKAVRPVINHWDPQALQDQASPSLLATVKPGQFASMFQFFQDKLGTSTSIEPCKGQARVNISTGNGRVITGAYACKAHFLKADAAVQLVLLKNRGEWRIAGFHVNSPAFFPGAQPGKT